MTVITIPRRQLNRSDGGNAAERLAFRSGTSLFLSPVHGIAVNFRMVDP